MDWVALEGVVINPFVVGRFIARYIVPQLGVNLKS